jgi:hypothetical protein
LRNYLFLCDLDRDRVNNLFFISRGSTQENNHKLELKHKKSVHLSINIWLVQFFTGTYTWPGGQSFQGHWMEGKQHGSGKPAFITFPQAETCFFGGLRDSMPQLHKEAAGNFNRWKRNLSSVRMLPDARWKFLVITAAAGASKILCSCC